MTSALTRREFLKLAGVGAGAITLGDCGVLSSRERGELPSPSHAQETGRVSEHTLEAAPVELGIGGRAV